jgi:EmrB/QacA subfamily drug resistance transporter
VDRKWWVLLTVGIATFMSALDGSVVNAVLPVMRRALGADVATIEWVVTVYLLVVSGLLLLFGRLGDLRGHKGLYVAGLCGFATASGLCGLAPSAAWLIAARTLQAVAAAMLFANSPAILTKTFPAAERGRALGLQATMTYLGLTAGPSIGGILAQAFGWPSIFWINVPIGAAGVWMAVRHVPRDEGEAERARFDFAGAALFFAGLFGLLLALDQGHAWGWDSALTVGTLAVSALLLAAFVAVETRRDAPMLDLRLFRSRTFSASSVSAVLNYIAVYGILFLVPFYLIGARGLGAAHAGLLLTAQPLVMTFAAPLSGTLSDRIGTRAPATVGMAFLCAGLFWLSRLDARTAISHVELALAVCGLGTGIFIAPNNSALMGAAPRERQGIAAGVLATARNMGMVLGVGIAGAIFNSASHGDDAPRAVARGVATGLVAGAIAAGVGAATSAVRGRA